MNIPSGPEGLKRMCIECLNPICRDTIKSVTPVSDINFKFTIKICIPNCYSSTAKLITSPPDTPEFTKEIAETTTIILTYNGTTCTAAALCVDEAVRVGDAGFDYRTHAIAKVNYLNFAPLEVGPLPNCPGHPVPPS